ncbi:CAHM6 protein, partial [Psophia crepitans]|nr:CAHM6 protein [Psophia crepitans]
MDKLRKVMDFCTHHQTVLGYSIVSLMTAASEHIFSSVVFKCPCSSGNMEYGSIFLLVPALILFLLGYMVNTRTWRLLTNRCPQVKCCTHSCWGTCVQYCFVLMLVTATASVAPLTWIAVALLGASFYECAASGNSLIQNYFCEDRGEECHKLMVKVPCDETLWKNISSESLSLQAQSQLIGWILIACIITVALIATCISHCCSPVSYLHLQFWKIYSQEEWKLFKIKAKEHATRMAEINVTSFFDATEPAPFQTPSNEEWQKISSLYTFNSQEQYYSMIHKFVNTERGNSSRFEEGDRNPPVLGFVDD